MVERAFRKKDKRPPDVCLLMVGYAAEEPAFKDFLSELGKDERKVTLFVIDPKDKGELSGSLQRLLERADSHHIKLCADLAFDLLLQILKERYRKDHYTWIPVDRHKVISYCLDYCLDQEVPGTPEHRRSELDRRFEVELILQAVKSRGFFNIEAIENVRRIREYSDNASKMIKQMGDSVIKQIPRYVPPRNPQDSDKDTAPDKDTATKPFWFGDNYQLILKDEDLANYVLKDASNQAPGKTIDEWTVTGSSESGWEAKCKAITYQDFLVERFEAIAAAPEFEVAKVSPSTRWHFRNPTSLRSVAELATRTADLLNNNLFKEDSAGAEGQIKLYGIWSTGEWLFHEKGWAWEEIGRKLVDDLLPNGRLTVNLVLANIPSTDEILTDRAARAKEVRERLESIEGASCELRRLDWWNHNRNLTLLCRSTEGAPRAGGIGGIYMRRRQATPLVEPVYVHLEEDCRVLGDIFKFYKEISVEEI